MRGNLTRRALWLCCALAVLVTVAFTLPALVRARHDWLRERLAAGRLAVLSLENQAADSPDALRLAGVSGVRLTRPEKPPVVVGVMNPLAARTINLDEDGTDASLWGTMVSLFASGGSLLLVAEPVSVAVDAAPLTRSLWAIVAPGLAIAILVAVCAYLAIRTLLLSPVRRLTGAIEALVAGSERREASRPAHRSSTEIAGAMEAVHALRNELGIAGWRRARLAAVATSTAKFSHDIRGVLAPAMLAAERLQANADITVRRQGEIALRSLEKAIELIRSELDIARDGTVPLGKMRFSLRETVARAAEHVARLAPALDVENQVDPALYAEADPAETERAIAALLRHAAASGARLVRIEATAERRLTLLIADDGKGLTPLAKDAPFKPMATGGQGPIDVALARDLARANRGDLQLVSTGPEGTSFRLFLPLARPSPPVSPAAAVPPPPENPPAP